METKFSLPWEKIQYDSHRCIMRAKTSIGTIKFLAVSRDWADGWSLAYVESPFTPELEVKAYGSTEEIAAEVSAAYAARVTAEYETLTKE